ARNARAREHHRLGRAHDPALGRRLPGDGRPAMIPVKDSQMRTPLRRVRGLGAGHSGTTTFWHQRLTAVAGVPLTIAVVILAVALLGRNHAAAVQILGSPLVAIVMLLFIV